MKPAQKLLASVLLATGCVVSTAASALTLDLNPAKDNSIYAENASRSNAGGPIFSGANSSGDERRGLLAFDVSIIPVGAVINSVTLRMTVINTNAPGGTQYNVHRLLSDWGEGTSSAGNPNSQGGGGGAAATPGDATWTSNFFGTNSWTTAGGDFVAGSSANAATQDDGSGGTLDDSFLNFSSATLRQDVQNWVDGVANNYGWIILGVAGTQTSSAFGSSESTLPNFAPLLSIDYTAPVPVPAAVWLFGSGLLGLASVARRRR